jgi:hypothetical protein
MQPARNVASVVDAFEALISATGASEFEEDQPRQIARKVLRQIIRKVTSTGSSQNSDGSGRVRE